MKRPRLALSTAALLAATFATTPASAQACGPLTFAFTTTGPGCDPTGTGPVPTLSVFQTPIPGVLTCPVQFVLNSNVVISPIPVPVLVLGLSNPALPLPGLPGCTLWTSLDLILSMGPGPAGPAIHALLFSLPPDPALIGTTVYGQAALPVPGGFRISNGTRVDIF